jgi:hypothetical protein
VFCERSRGEQRESKSIDSRSSTARSRPELATLWRKSKERKMESRHREDATLDTNKAPKAVNQFRK